MNKKILYTSHTANFQKFNRPFMRMMRGTLEGEYAKQNIGGWEVHYASAGEEEILDCDKSFTVDFARSPFRLDKHIRAYRQLKKILKDSHYDIIHTHTPVGSVITRLAARKTRKSGTRVIYTAHGFHFYKGASLFNWILWYPTEKIMAHFTDDIIAINNEDYERAKQKLKARIHYVPGVGVDPKKFQIKMTKKERDAYRATLGLKPDDFVMIYVAELIDRKRHTKLLKDFGDYLKTTPSRILFVGNGSNLNKLKNIVQKKHIIGKTMFLGYRQDIPELLKISDVYLSSSRQEGLCCGVAEARIANLPIFATQARGVDDIICKPDLSIFFLNNINKLMENIYEK